MSLLLGPPNEEGRLSIEAKCLIFRRFSSARLVRGPYSEQEAILFAILSMSFVNHANAWRHGCNGVMPLDYR